MEKYMHSLHQGVLQSVTDLKSSALVHPSFEFFPFPCVDCVKRIRKSIACCFCDSAGCHGSTHRAMLTSASHFSGVSNYST